MNYILDAIPVLIVVLFIYLGKIDGFLKSLIGLVGYVLTIVLSFSLSEIVATDIYNNWLKNTIEQAVEKNQMEFIDQELVDTIFKPTAVSVVKLIVMILMVVIMFFLVRFLSKILSKLLNKTFLNIPNKLLGAVLGAVKGVAVVLLLIGVIILIVPVISKDIELFSPSTIEKTYVFKYLYDFVNTLI